MKPIGIRELKERATEVVRAVREEHAEYVITWRGSPVAVLRPLMERELADMQVLRRESALGALDLLAADVAAGWRAPLSGVAIIDQQRR